MTSVIKSLRSYKIGKYALLDFILSFVGMYYLGPSLLGLESDISLLIALPLGIVLHRLLNIDTPMTTEAFDKGWTDVRIFMLVLLFMAIYIHYKRKIEALLGKLDLSELYDTLISFSN
jgi:hypothetical protein